MGRAVPKVQNNFLIAWKTGKLVLGKVAFNLASIKTRKVKVMFRVFSFSYKILGFRWPVFFLINIYRQSLIFSFVTKNTV